MGFVAFGQHYAAEELEQPVEGCGEVIHLVIDMAEQGLGYGREATLLAVEQLQSEL